MNPFRSDHMSRAWTEAVSSFLYASPVLFNPDGSRATADLGGWFWRGYRTVERGDCWTWSSGGRKMPHYAWFRAGQHCAKHGANS
jgi:hypothetical protein